MSDVNVYIYLLNQFIYPLKFVHNFNDKITEIFVKPVLEVMYLCYCYFSKVLK